MSNEKETKQLSVLENKQTAHLTKAYTHLTPPHPHTYTTYHTALQHEPDSHTSSPIWLKSQEYLSTGYRKKQ